MKEEYVIEFVTDGTKNWKRWNDIGSAEDVFSKLGDLFDYVKDEKMFSYRIIKIIDERNIR